MKKSITYLPHINRPDLNFLTEYILKRAKQTEMIILFVNYARKDYVVYDEKFEFGKLQFSVSEYDILVATNGISERDTGKALDNIKILYYNRAKAPEHEPPVQFITIDIKKLNKELDKGRHFFMQIKQEVVMPYESGKFKLNSHRTLNFNKIKQQTQEYFSDKFEVANEFLYTPRLICKEEYYKRALLQLHQACENFFYSIRLVYMQQHNLTKLRNSV